MGDARQGPAAISNWETITDNFIQRKSFKPQRLLKCLVLYYLDQPQTYKLYPTEKKLYPPLWRHDFERMSCDFGRFEFLEVLTMRFLKNICADLPLRGDNLPLFLYIHNLCNTLTQWSILLSTPPPLSWWWQGTLLGVRAMWFVAIDQDLKKLSRPRSTLLLTFYQWI